MSDDKFVYVLMRRESILGIYTSLELAQSDYYHFGDDIDKAPAGKEWELDPYDNQWKLEPYDIVEGYYIQRVALLDETLSSFILRREAERESR